MREPITAYKEDYPGHSVEARTCAETAAPANIAFTADSEYFREYAWKTGPARPAPPAAPEAAAHALGSAPFMVRVLFSPVSIGQQGAPSCDSTAVWA